MFPSSDSTKNSLAEVFLQVRREAANVKRTATKARDFMATNAVSANQVIQLLQHFKSAGELFSKARQTPGIAKYAQDQFNDTTFDVVRAFTDMETALTNTMQWIKDNFPSDASGYLLKDQIAADFGISVRRFTSAQTLGLRTQLDALIATID